MKRIGLCCTLLILCLFPLQAQAEESAADTDTLYAEQWAASGVEDLWSVLPEETRELLNEWGVYDFSDIDLTGSQPQEVLKGLWRLFTTQSSGPLAACGVVIGTVILCALMDGLRQGNESAASSVFSLVGAVASYTAVLVPLIACVHRVCDAVESAGVFMASFVPVYAGIMVAGGQAVTAASYQTILLFAAELMTLLVTRVVVPCLMVSMAFSLTGSVTPTLKLQAAGGMFNKASVWLLSLTATLFTGLLSLQGLVGSAADSLSGRAIRFSLASFVPVVGGALSEAFNTVKGCLSLLRTTVGGIGILVTAIIVLPPLLECILWNLCLSLCGMAADMFGLPSLGGLLRAAQGTVKTLTGVLAICSLLLIIGTTIVTMAGGQIQV